MPVKKLKDFLDGSGVKYITISHSPAYTAHEVAASAHLPARQLAKTVVVKVDGRIALAVLPATHRIDLDLLKDGIGAGNLELATEQEFRDMFPECAVGAMPPFGNLYGMDVFVAKRLTEDAEIAFNAGSHTELVKLAYADFEKLVNPRVIVFSAR